MKPTKHYLKAILITLITLSLLLSGCASDKRENREERRETQKIEQETPLLVFMTSTYCLDIISNFQMEYPDMKLEVVYIDEEAARRVEEEELPQGYMYTLDDAMEYYIQQHGSPDLIISTTEKISAEKLPAWIESGWVQEMSQYFGDDPTFDTDTYYPGTAEIGRVDGVLYALPLALNTEYWTLRDEVWNDTEFGSLKEGYSAADLLSCVEMELEAEIAAGTDGWTVLDNGCSFMNNTYSWLHKFGAIQITNGEVALDQDLFTQICRVQSLCMDNVMERESILWVLNTSANPSNAGEQYYVTQWSSNINQIEAPQIGLIHAQSLTQGVFQQDSHVLWLPHQTKDGENEYAAEVAYWAMIGSETQRAQEAYDVLRLMMDMPSQYRVTSIGHGSTSGINAYLPINRQNALDMITQMEESTITTFATENNGVNGAVPEVSMTEELRESMENFLSNITKLYTEDDDMMYEIANVLYQYKNSGGTDYSECYDTVLAILQESRSGEK